MGYNSELQALRELAHWILPQLKCFFCEQPMMELHSAEVKGFGHRRHNAVKTKFTFHHKDRNRNNNSIVFNIRISHPQCHKSHHITERTK